MIGVVIPYFQHAPGLLTRALQSVAAQLQPAVRIYVVDDGSPSPADAELIRLPRAFPHEVRVLRQPNGGPGTARNRALDSLDADVRAVAFLDSDDVWRSDHLSHATTALGAGAQFYFADHQREGEDQSRFRQCAFGPDGPPLRPEMGLYWCDPARVFHAVVERSPVGTSTVVLRRDVIGAARFSTRLRSAGEDSILWLEILGERPRTACSIDNEVAYGRGVNVFSHGGWGDARSMQTTLDEMRSQEILRSSFALEPDLRARSLAQSRRLDLSFCANLLACGRRLQWSAAGPALGYLSQRPWAVLRLPQALAEALQQRRAPSRS